MSRVAVELATHERAIVQRMSKENTEVKSFFTRFEAANAIFDVDRSRLVMPRSSCLVDRRVFNA